MKTLSVGLFSSSYLMTECCEKHLVGATTGSTQFILFVLCRWRFSTGLSHGFVASSSYVYSDLLIILHKSLSPAFLGPCQHFSALEPSGLCELLTCSPAYTKMVIPWSGASYPTSGSTDQYVFRLQGFSRAGRKSVSAFSMAGISTLLWSLLGDPKGSTGSQNSLDRFIGENFFCDWEPSHITEMPYHWYHTQVPDLNGTGVVQKLWTWME